MSTKNTIKKTKKTKKKAPAKINYADLAKELRTQIIDVNDFPVEEVDVPEWGLAQPIYIRTMSAKERDDFEARQLIDAKGGGKQLSLDNIRASMLIEVMCADPKGEHKIFDSSKDIVALGNKSATALDRCVLVMNRLNRSNPEDEKALLKNLQGQDEISGSTKQGI